MASVYGKQPVADSPCEDYPSPPYYGSTMCNDNSDEATPPTMQPVLIYSPTATPVTPLDTVTTDSSQITLTGQSEQNDI